MTGYSLSMAEHEDKGEWARTAEEGIVPDELGSDAEDPSVGTTTGDDRPATAEGVDTTAGDAADAVTDGGQALVRPQGRGCDAAAGRSLGRDRRRVAVVG